ncbi:MAG: zinc ribbon domain-containing protein [bacterium]|nr:zinc ribbon domain-containing protein [bacterium]
MPLFTYECGDCGNTWELLARSSEVAKTCPACGSENTQRAASAFACGTAKSASSGACSTGCCPFAS